MRPYILYQIYVLYIIFLSSRIGILQDHEGEISNCVYNWDCNLVASSSLDKTAKVWDIRMRDCIFTLNSHTDEVIYCKIINKRFVKMSNIILKFITDFGHCI